MSSPTTKSEAKEEKVKKLSDKDLDLSNANRGVWLVKVPKYIAERWESGNTAKDVGKLKIKRVQGQKPQVSFSLEDSLTKGLAHHMFSRFRNLRFFFHEIFFVLIFYKVKVFY